jgi:hypothetical protein
MISFIYFIISLPIATVAIPALFWGNELLALVLLALVTLCAMTVKIHRRHLITFVYGAILGPLSELVCIYFGAWSYTNVSMLPIPLWLPIAWGLAGVHISEVNELIEKLLTNRTWYK